MGEAQQIIESRPRGVTPAQAGVSGSGSVGVGAKSSRLSAAIRAAEEAGAHLLAAMNSGSIGISYKPDGTPATDADRSCERLLRDRLLGAFPEDGLLGEEFGETPSRNGSRWIIDPIDGTVSFIRGIPLFGVMVAWQREFASDGEVTLGVVSMPMLGSLYFAESGFGSWCKRGSVEASRLEVSETATLDRAVVSTTSMDYFRASGATAVFERVSERCGLNRGLPDCYGPLLLASGQIDAVYEPLVYPYDVAALEVIVREAGGRCSDWSGGPCLESRSVVYTNGVLHGAMLGLLSGSVG